MNELKPCLYKQLTTHPYLEMITIKEANLNRRKKQLKREIDKRKNLVVEQRLTSVDVVSDAPEIENVSVSRIEKALHGKTPEEQFVFLHWLMFDYGTDTSNSDIARINWLKGEKDGKIN